METEKYIIASHFGNSASCNTFLYTNGQKLVKVNVFKLLNINKEKLPDQSIEGGTILVFFNPPLTEGSTTKFLIIYRVLH